MNALSSPVRDVDISKFMSRVLRHAPEQAGLVLDESGWTDFSALCSAVTKRFGASAEDVRRVVDENPKKRFVVEGGRIRAAQGHSVAVDLGLQPAVPPPSLFHGTKAASLRAILREGLTKQARHHVHLSPDAQTARVVALRRKGDDVILKIDAGRMAMEGFTFFKSENGVWLTDQVPPAFITSIGHEAQP